MIVITFIFFRPAYMDEYEKLEEELKKNYEVNCGDIQSEKDTITFCKFLFEAYNTHLFSFKLKSRAPPHTNQEKNNALDRNLSGVTTFVT